MRCTGELALSLERFLPAKAGALRLPLRGSGQETAPADKVPRAEAESERSRQFIYYRHIYETEQVWESFIVYSSTHQHK